MPEPCVPQNQIQTVPVAGIYEFQRLAFQKTGESTLSAEFKLSDSEATMQARAEALYGGTITVTKSVTYTDGVADEGSTVGIEFGGALATTSVPLIIPISGEVERLQYPIQVERRLILDAASLALSDGAPVTAWSDDTGNNPDTSVASGGPTYDATEQAVRFDSSNLDRLELPITEEIELVNGGRIFAEVKRASAIPGGFTESIVTQCILNSYDSTAGGQGLSFFETNYNDIPKIIGGSSFGSIDDSGNLSTAAYQLLEFAYKPDGTAKLFLDGVEIASGTCGLIAAGTKNLQIGGFGFFTATSGDLGRHWDGWMRKIHITGPMTDAEAAVYRSEMLGAPVTGPVDWRGVTIGVVTGGANVAPGGTASASNYYVPGEPSARGYDPASAIDSDTDTLWLAGELVPAWIQVDRGAGALDTINAYGQFFDSENFTTDDGLALNWRIVTSPTGDFAGEEVERAAVVNGSNVRDVYNRYLMTPNSDRYVRLYIDNVVDDVAAWPGVTEFQLLVGANETFTESGVQAALRDAPDTVADLIPLVGGTPSVIGSATDAANAFDGDAGTAAHQTGGYVVWDFGTPRTVQEIKVNIDFTGGGSGSLAVDGWNGGEWERIYTNYGVSDSSNFVFTPEVIGRFSKFRFHGSNFDLYEVELRGNVSDSLNVEVHGSSAPATSGDTATISSSYWDSSYIGDYVKASPSSLLFGAKEIYWNGTRWQIRNGSDSYAFYCDSGTLEGGWTGPFYFAGVEGTGSATEGPLGISAFPVDVPASADFIACFAPSQGDVAQGTSDIGTITTLQDGGEAPSGAVATVTQEADACEGGEESTSTRPMWGLMFPRGMR